MRAVTHLLALWLAFSVCISCTSQEERGFHSNDFAYMQHVKEALSTEKIPYREDQEGFIRYASSDEERVKSTQVRVATLRSSGIAEKYDGETALYANEALKAMQATFRVETRSDGEWILWWPANEGQEQELAGRIASIHFDRIQKTGGGCQPQAGGHPPC